MGALQHTPDCRCVDGTVTLRVVVQNTGADIVRVEVDDCSLSWLVAEANDNANAILRAAGARELQGREHARAVQRTGTILECSAIARGHERRTFPTDGTMATLVAPAARVGRDGGPRGDGGLRPRARFLGARHPESKREGATATPSPTFIDDSTVHHPVDGPLPQRSLHRRRQRRAPHARTRSRRAATCAEQAAFSMRRAHLRPRRAALTCTPSRIVREARAPPCRAAAFRCRPSRGRVARSKAPRIFCGPRILPQPPTSGNARNRAAPRIVREKSRVTL